MKLIQHTPTTTYQVLTEYTEISKESPFISILKVCSEQSPFTVDDLQDFLRPLNKNAVKNIIHRLEQLDYLMKYKEDSDEDYQEHSDELEYWISARGIEVCLKEEIEEEKRGIIAMTIAYPKNAHPIIVKLEPLSKDGFQDQESTKNNAKREFNDFINQSQHLKNGTFKLKHIEDTYVVREKKEQDYIFNFNEENYRSQLLDFSNTVETSKSEVIAELLTNEYQSAYDAEQQLIRMTFNSKELSLKRKISIENPKYNGLYFNKIELEKPVQISPLDDLEAEKWFTALVVSRIQNYFFSDEEFDMYTEQIAEEFVEYKQGLTNSISRSQLIHKLNEKPAGFYIKAKLDTINYLNY